nr:non-ribosomal peptide synthetase [uncultured Chitinophaga sp.]
MLNNQTLDFQAMESNRNIIARNYWQKRLENIEPVACFADPDASMAGAGASHDADYTFTAPAAASEMLGKAAPTAKARHILLLTALGALAYRCYSQDDFVVLCASYSGGRDKQLIPVRMGNYAGNTFATCLHTVKDKLLNDFSHDNYPLAKILDAANAGWRHIPFTGMLLQDIQDVSAFDTGVCDILFAFRTTEALVLNIRYNTALFSEPFIRRIAACYMDLLCRLIAESDQVLDQVEVVPADERNWLLYALNNTSVPYPQEETIISVFEAQCRKTPGNIAVRLDGKTYTYSEIKERSDQIAAWLQQKGMLPGDLAGVLLDRGHNLIPAILGIMKTGAAYVPMDAAYPAGRVQSIINDSGMKIVLTEARYNNVFSAFSVMAVNPDTDVPYRWNHEFVPPPALKGDMPAYVIYTSGSTGQPKGVVIAHHSVVNRLIWMQQAYPLQEQDVLIQKTPVVFDVSVWELFWWAFAGASLYMLPPGKEKEPPALIGSMLLHGVTCVHFVPSMLRYFLDHLELNAAARDLSKLKIVFCSGEELRPEQVLQFDKVVRSHYPVRLVNLYGPTEATVDISYYECLFASDNSRVPIGRPIDNTRFYILDSNGKLCLPGFPGELCVAGAGLAKGYLNQETLTVEKFGYNQYIPEERIYKTGDLARWLPDGNMAFLGRIDDQVKVRGFRIEPGEIESLLVAYEGIKEGVVALKGKDNDKYVVAYYVADTPIDTAPLKAYLAASLPDYMLPAFYVRCEKIPLTISGKANRKALPEPVLAKEAEHTPPSGATEQQLAEIWAKVLNADKAVLSVNKSFFELGGNSLKVLELVNRIKDSLKAEVTIPDVFQFPTIQSLAKFITDSNSPETEYQQALTKDATDMKNIVNLFGNSGY